MYWASPLLAKAVSLGLVDPRHLERMARRVRRSAGDLPLCDLIWAEELVRSRHITRYQSRALLQSPGAENSSNESPPDPTGLPLQVGQYLVLDRIGRSDLGATFRCRRRTARDVVAVKLLDSKWTADELVRSRLSQEVEAWASLKDPRIVAQRLECESGAVALASKWIDYQSLAEWFRGGHCLPPDGVSVLLRELIGVLASADAQGLVHGDLRPASVLLDGRGRIFLADCGVRRAIAGAGLIASRELSPERYDCVAPEVASGEQTPDAASDIYSLGCLLFHLLTGRPPYFGGNAERKCAAHQAGRHPSPRSLGLDLSPELRLILSATLQPDRTRRVGSYNELLRQLSPTLEKSARLHKSETRLSQLVGWTTRSLPDHLSSGTGISWAKWFVGTAATVATVAGLMVGSARLMPMLSIHVPKRTSATPPVGTVDSQHRPGVTDLTAVTALWNATEDLRTAYKNAEPHATITLKSPGPFLLDAIEINKPITLRGAEDTRPLFLGGPGSALHIAAAEVRLENIHFLRVQESIAGATHGEAHALVEAAGSRLVISNCSFQDLSDSGSTTAAIQWKPTSVMDEVQPALLEAKNILFRQVGAGLRFAGTTSSQIHLENCLHLGPGPLISSTSPTGNPFEGFDITLSRVTVYGAGTVVHGFPHPLENVLPLRVVADESLLVPREREQSVLAIRYATQPGMLMPKVSWSGSNTICPADATLLEVWRGPDAAPWRATGVAAWKAYWGTHVTGLVGVRLGLANSPVNAPNDVPRPQVNGASTAGADSTRLCYPLPVALEQLPVLLERLSKN